MDFSSHEQNIIIICMCAEHACVISTHADTWTWNESTQSMATETLTYLKIFKIIMIAFDISKPRQHWCMDYPNDQHKYCQTQ